MNFRLNFWHHHSIPWPRFPYRARYFRDLRTFSVDFCIGSAECPPYFYFRSSWPTDLESVPRDAHLVMKVSIKFEADTIIRSSYSVIAADTLRDLVTLTFNLLTLFSGNTWRVTWSTPPPSLKILRLSVLELWVPTAPTGYHWQCVCSHVTYA